MTGHSVRIRGFFEGLALKSAGIYDDDQLVRDLKVDQLPGRQQVNFDIEVEEVEPGMVLRVYDGAGLSAEASIASRLGIQGTGGAKEVELGPPSDVPVSIGDEAPSVEVNAPDGNVAEIPSSASPSQRHVAHRAPNTQLGDLQVNIISATLDDAETHAYDVIGQINGSRVSHAGIYVDGKLVRPIDLDPEDGFTVEPFDETFQMNGRHATVRVYNVRDEYIERPINLAAAVPEMPGGDMSEMPAIVMNPNPNQLAVQITGVRQIAANAMVIGGVLSGKNLSAAGVYQNGIEVQIAAGVGGSAERARFELVSPGEFHRDGQSDRGGGHGPRVRHQRPVRRAAADGRGDQPVRDQSLWFGRQSVRESLRSAGLSAGLLSSSAVEQHALVAEAAALKRLATWALDP